jgi:hypothetical protein
MSEAMIDRSNVSCTACSSVACPLSNSESLVRSLDLFSARTQPKGTATFVTLGAIPVAGVALVARPMLGTVLGKERGVMLTLALTDGSAIVTPPRLGAVVDKELLVQCLLTPRPTLGAASGTLLLYCSSTWPGARMRAAKPLSNL